jgi:tetratricopeptide (TPR) repeat protein
MLNAAVSDFAIAVGSDPSFAYAFKDLGVVKLSLATADAGRNPSAALIGESVQHFTRALEIKNDLEGALYERGRAYYALANYVEALDDWKRCASLSPSRAKKVEPLIRDAEEKLRGR